MTKTNSKVTVPTNNGKADTPTTNPNTVNRMGIPAPSKGSSANIKVSLAPNVLDVLASNPLPPQAHCLLLALDNLGGTATKSDILKELDNTPFSSTQSKDRIWSFYRQRLMGEGKAYGTANPYLVKA